MSISLHALKMAGPIERVIIHSLDQSLYQVSVVIDGAERYVTDNNGKLLRSFNKLELQVMFEKFTVGQTVLRHHSAYDEMVGQPLKDGSNMLEVPLGNSGLASH